MTLTSLRQQITTYTSDDGRAGIDVWFGEMKKVLSQLEEMALARR